LPDIGEQRSPVELGTLEADIGGDVFRRRIEDRARLEFAQFPRDRVQLLRGGHLGWWLRHLRLVCRHRLYAIEPVAEPALLAVEAVCRSSWLCLARFLGGCPNGEQCSENHGQCWEGQHRQ